jgi:hypothetical protein
MKRFTGVRILTQALTPSDVGIFIGDGICREASPYLGEGSYLFFSDKEDYILSMALGMAMCTDKRIFVFCDDQYFIRNMSEAMQMGVSKSRNLYIVLFIAGEYLDVPDTPNIFGSVNSQHGVLYNMGFIVHDYKTHFKNSRNPINFVRETWDRVRGPLIVLLVTTKGSKQMPEIKFSSREDVMSTKEFILNEDIIAHIFVAPMGLSNFED